MEAVRISAEIIRKIFALGVSKAVAEDEFTKEQGYKIVEMFDTFMAIISDEERLRDAERMLGFIDYSMATEKENLN